MDIIAEVDLSAAPSDAARESAKYPVSYQADAPIKSLLSPVPSVSSMPGVPPSPRDSEQSSSSTALIHGKKNPLAGPLKSALTTPNRSGFLNEAESSTGNPLLVAIRREVGESEKRLTERLVRVERRIEQFRESFYTSFTEKLNEAKQWHPEYDRRLAQMEGGVEGVNGELSSLDRKLRNLEPKIADLARRQIEDVFSVKLVELDQQLKEHALVHADRVMKLQTAFDDLTGYTGRLATLEVQLEAHSEAHERLRSLTRDYKEPISGTAVDASNGNSHKSAASLGMGPSPMSEPRALEPGSLDRLNWVTNGSPGAGKESATEVKGHASPGAQTSELLRCERLAVEAADIAEKAVRESERFSSHIRQMQLQAEEQKVRVINLNERLTVQESQMRTLSENSLENGYQRSAPDQSLHAEVDKIACKVDCHRIVIEEMKKVIDEKIWGRVKELERTVMMPGISNMRKEVHGTQVRKPMWSTSQCFLLCKETEVPIYLDHAKELVDCDGKSPSLEEGVRMLNGGEFPCEEGYCIIHCDLDKAYYVLYKLDMREDALKLLDVTHDLTAFSSLQSSEPAPIAKSKTNSKAASDSLCGGCLPASRRARKPK